MHIANLTEEGRGGGPLYGMVTTALDLTKAGVSNAIIFPYFEAEKFRIQLQNAGINYKQLPLHHLTKYPPHLIKYCVWFFFEILILVIHFRKEKYDLIMCHGSYQIKGIIAAKIAGIPTIWHMNDSQQPSLVRKLFKIFSNIPTAYMFASNKSKDYYSAIESKILEKPHQVIASPININKFTKPSSAKTELQSSEKLKLITVSYLNANKNVELIIRALVELNKKGIDNIELYIVGPILESQAQYKSTLDAIIANDNLDNIHFLGYRSDIPELLRDADVYICSSNFESSPIAVWEAMVSQTMVITTNVGDVQEIVTDNQAGIVVPVGDVEAMSTAIFTSMDKNVRDQYATKGKLVALQYFESSSIANEIKLFISTVLSESNK